MNTWKYDERLEIFDLESQTPEILDEIEQENPKDHSFIYSRIAKLPGKRGRTHLQVSFFKTKTMTEVKLIRSHKNQ